MVISVRLEPNDLNTGNSGQGKVLQFEAHHPQHQDSRYLRRLRALSPSHRGNLHRRKKFWATNVVVIGEVRVAAAGALLTDTVLFTW